MLKFMSIKVCEELYLLIAEEADRLGMAMTDVIAKRLAKSFKRPELGFVPRKPQGRRRVRPYRRSKI